MLDIIRTIYGKNTLITSPHQRSLPRHRVAAAPEVSAAESQELEDIVQFFRDSYTKLEDYIHSKPSAEDQEHDSDIEDITEEPRGRKADSLLTKWFGVLWR